MSPAEYKAKREQLDLTQAELAALLGVPRESISRRESGKQAITAEAVLALRALAPEKRKRSGGSNVTSTYVTLAIPSTHLPILPLSLDPSPPLATPGSPYPLTHT